MASKSFATLIVAILSLTCAATGIEIGEPCTTPGGKSGLCVKIKECRSITDLILRQNATENDRTYVRQSLCGFHESTVVICCPDNVRTLLQARGPSERSAKLALLPPATVCGRYYTQRIALGFYAHISEYPWMALLQYSRGKEAGTGHHCGGTLINERYVLTAAHCVTGLPDEWTMKSVRLGEWNTSADPDCVQISHFGRRECADPHVDIPVEKVIPHENFVPTPSNGPHDIALIRLSSRVNYTKYIRPVCLPVHVSDEIDARILLLVGWGASADGLWTSINSKSPALEVPLSECQKATRGRLQLESTQLCIEGKMENATCRIDSGGGVFKLLNSRMNVFGVQSFGLNDCSLDRSAMVLTKVTDYRDWILDNIEP